MGEYFTVKADNKFGYESTCKLGTCNDWRYTRREEAEYLAPLDAGFGTNIPAALAEESILYRFPFPWEDAKNHSLKEILSRISKRDMNLHYILPAPFALLSTILHKELVLSYQGLNYFVPCPFSETFRKAVSHQWIRISHCDYRQLIVYGEQYHAGQAATVFKCRYCDRLFYLNQEELDLLKPPENKNPSKDSLLLGEIFKRLKAKKANEAKEAKEEA